MMMQEETSTALCVLHMRHRRPLSVRHTLLTLPNAAALGSTTQAFEGTVTDIQSNVVFPKFLL